MADKISVMAAKVTITALLYIILLRQLQNTEGCRTGDLRTVPGNPDDGKHYPMYCHNGQWRRVCTGGGGTGSWLDSSARVACRQLGYCGLIDYGYNCPDAQLTDTTPITPMPVRLAVAPTCAGTESRIQDCGDGIVETSCQCGSLAWLTCQSVCANGEVRLVGGSTDNQGRVEVCVDGRWGTVCKKNNQQLPEAAVCSQLGYVSDGALTTTSTSSSPTMLVDRPITTCSVQSGGSLSCNAVTDTSCNHSMDLGVVCRTYQQLYNELLDQCFSTDSQPTSLANEDPTLCPTECATNYSSVNTTNPNRTSSFPSSDKAVLEAIIGTLVAVIVAMAIGWLCSCVIMKKQSTVILLEKSEGRNSTLQRELKNPVYEENNSSQPQTNDTTKLDMYDNATQKPVVTKATYDVVEGQDGTVYSVVEQTHAKEITSGAGYNVLVHKKP